MSSQTQNTTQQQATNLQGAADFLGVHRDTAHRLIKDGHLKAAKVRGRVYVRFAELERLLDGSK